MDDEAVISHIDSLVDEEHRLRQRVGDGEALSDEDRARLEAVEARLDQCWDLLRRRRARRRAGGEADDEQARPESVVEHYQQ